MRLVSVGNVVVDVVVDVPALPPAGGDVLASGGGLAVGGTFNVLAAARRHGMEAAYAGVLGAGPLAALALEALAAEGVTVAGPRHPDLDTGFSVAVVDAAGERTFLTRVGAEATLTTVDVTVGAGDWVLVSGYGLVHPVNRRALERWVPSLPAGVLVVFDPGPLPGVASRAVLDRADWVTANDREAARLGPVPAALVTRRGAAGCTVRLPGQPPVEVPGFAVDAVDTNGAGDAHTGALIARLAGGYPPVEAARLANAAAALAVTRRGPATSPTAAEAERWATRARSSRGTIGHSIP